MYNVILRRVRVTTVTVEKQFFCFCFFFFFLLLLLLCGTTVQCGPKPPSWASPSQLCFWPLSPGFNFAFSNICLYTVPPSVCWSSSSSTSLKIIVKYLTYFSFTIHSINMINPIQPTFSDKIKAASTFWRRNVCVLYKDSVRTAQ